MCRCFSTTASHLLMELPVFEWWLILSFRERNPESCCSTFLCSWVVQILGQVVTNHWTPWKKKIISLFTKKIQAFAAVRASNRYLPKYGLFSLLRSKARWKYSTPSVRTWSFVLCFQIHDFLCWLSSISELLLSLLQSFFI